MSQANAEFQLVPLRRGGMGIRSERYGEICHPGVGPREEAEQVYVGALGLRGRWATEPGDFVVWDVGLGGAANATAVIQAAAAVDCSLRVVSFDWGPEPLRFALRHACELGYFGELKGWCQILADQGLVRFELGRVRVRWELVAGDFTERMKWSPGETADFPAPHAILYDPHSPSANPEMWTLPLFEALRGRLDSNRLCGLATYSRSTAVRVALLLAGFWVGVGVGTATKEETTVASNRKEGVAVPLDGRWLERCRRSGAAEPWDRPPFGGRPLTEATWARLREHPQFVGGQGGGAPGNGALPTVGLDAL